MAIVKRFLGEEEGADATEYALVIGLVALAIVVGATALGNNLSSAFSHIATVVKTDTGS